MPRLRSLQPDASMLDVYRLDMELARPLLRLQQQLLRGPSPFTAAERELIAAYVSGLNACGFCVGVHRAVATGLGVEPAALEALLADGPSPERHGRLVPVLAFVRKLTLTPSRMTDADAEAVRAAGWDDLAVFHATLVCALFSFFNRLADGLGLDPARVDVRRVADGLVSIGYEGRL
jgi:uncharacterized peroxidase-related enzyme